MSLKKVEEKITLTTTEVEGHTHERFFEDGPIEPGTYETTEGGSDSHTHFFVISETITPGQTATVTTSPPNGQEEGHQHSLEIRAVQPEDMANREEDGGDMDDEKGRFVDDGKARGVEVKVIHGGRVVETKESERNGVPVGIVAGYISTWTPDTGGIFGVPDQFVPGAWAESLAEHRARGNRQVRLKDMHGRTIGGFPIETVREDDRGLFGVGEINLVSQLGREAFSLARQGVLTDFSVGFSAVDDTVEGGLRLIRKAILWEGSIVDEPANQAARITEVKKINIDKANEMTAREIEEVLISTGAFSKTAARMLAGRLALTEPKGSRYDQDQLASILRELREMKALVKRDPAGGR